MTTPPRIGITGFAHETNALAAAVTLGDGLQIAATPGGLAATWEAGPLLARLRELGDVEIVELPVWEFGASGPLDGHAFRTVVAQVTAALHAAGPLDALAVLGHGAGTSTDDRDTDGTFLTAVRSQVGAHVPLGAVLDFHANLSAAMVEACDIIVGYRTNPHVDIHDRLVELAEHLHQALAGRRTTIAWCQLPLVVPQIGQLTAPTEPFGRVIYHGQQLVTGSVRNVSVFGGFSLGDTEHCGASVAVAADVGHEASAAAAAHELAEHLWSLRSEYRIAATPLAAAVHEAGRAASGRRSPVILADVADNPGGGAPCNSTFVLRALLDAGVQHVVLGLQCDAAVVAAAFAAGVGAQIDIEFNRDSTHPLAQPLTCQAEVLALTTASLMPNRGVYAGSTRHPGPSCALRIEGVQVGVSSYKVQCADDDTLRFVGLQPDLARVVVVKSRGHFRAGFDHLFADDQIIEVGAPGVATVALDTIDWKYLPRPVWPLDEIDDWQPIVRLQAEVVL